MARAPVLTAAGLITAVGDTPAAWGAALAAATAGHDAPPAAAGAAARPIGDFEPKRYLDRKGLKNLSRTSQLACCAASRLLESLSDLAPEAVGVVLGSAWASLDTIVRFEREAHLEGPRFVDPILFTETVANVPAGQVSIFFGWSALNATVSSGTSSGFDALERACRFLDEGRAEAIVAGGSDELNRHLLAALALTAGKPGPTTCGEAACLFVVESAGHAAGRGAPVLAELSGAAVWFVDPAHPRAAALRAARVSGMLEAAATGAADVDLLVLSANGRAPRDAMESALVADVWGGTPPPSILPKRLLGETWGASGPLGAAAALESMRRGPRAPRRAVVLDCAETGHCSALLLGAPEA